MNTPLNDIELIERYLDDDLTVEEASGFHRRLEADPEFQKLFQREKVIIGAIRFRGAQDTLKFLKGEEERLSALRVGATRSFWIYVAAAACVGLVALAAAWQWRTTTSQELYAAYVSPYPNVMEPALRGDDDAATRRSQALRAYEAGDYAAAALMLGEVVRERPDDGMLLLLGNAQLLAGRTAEARASFTRLLDDYDTWDTEAKWYLALSYLKAGETEKAKVLFRQVVVADSAFVGEARDILGALE